jgi:hypothetical protein
LGPAVREPMQLAEHIGDAPPVGFGLGRSALHVGHHHQAAVEVPAARGRDRHGHRHPFTGVGRVRLLADGDRPNLDPALLEMMEYRKSGLSLNWIVGCPLDGGYCVRHLFGNSAMKVPRALTTDLAAFELSFGLLIVA